MVAMPKNSAALLFLTAMAAAACGDAPSGMFRAERTAQALTAPGLAPTLYCPHGSDREKARRFDRAERGRAQRRVATRESQRQGRSLRSRRTRPAARVPDPGLRALQKAPMVRMDAGLSWSGRASDVQPAGNPQEVLGDPADCRARARSRRSYGRVSQRSLPPWRVALRLRARSARVLPGDYGRGGGRRPSSAAAFD